MFNEPLISLIIPIYNAIFTIDRCLNSVVNQSFEDWECFLVDDGSNDGSSESCDRWAMADSRISALHQSNKGVSEARNNGLNLCKGKFVCFIDADDWVDPYFLHSLIMHIDNTEWVIGGMRKVYEDGKVLFVRPGFTGTFEVNNDLDNRFVMLNESFLAYTPHEKLYRLNIIRQYNISFPVGCNYGEDLRFNFQYLNHISSISCVDEAFYNYHVGAETLSTRFRPNQFDEDYEHWRLVTNYFIKRRLWNEQAKELLYKRLWGILYDGLFLYPKIRERGIDYLKHVLNTPEIEDLKHYQHVFFCSSWIKKGILWHCDYFFYMYFTSKLLF